MLQLDNQTPFVTHLSVLPDPAGVDTLNIVLKATFSHDEGVQQAAEQEPVATADAYLAEPGASSLIQAAEVHPTRQGTDVVLIGEAVAPGGRQVEKLDASVSVAGRGRAVRVFGDRQWVNGVNGVQPGRPRPFASMPLVFERAFGGVVRGSDGGVVAHDERNPVGVGMWSGVPSGAVGSPLPNLEDPGQLLRTPGDCPAPACFGPVAPSWQPRVGFVGTCDEAWQRERAPLLPVDFDPRFFCVAPAGLSFPQHLQGGEPVQLTGVSLAGPLRFSLPVCRPVATVALGRELERPPFWLEKVRLDPGERRFSMLWRASLPCDKQALKIRAVQVSLQELSMS